MLLTMGFMQVGLDSIFLELRGIRGNFEIVMIKPGSKITSSQILAALEYKSNITSIENEESFYNMVKLSRAIIYISVNWSGQEKISRKVVYTILNNLKLNDLFFKLDCSEGKNKYVEDWLGNQTGSIQSSYSNGYGELLFVNYGKVIDYIKYPGELGIEKTKIKIEHWLNHINHD